METIHLKTFLSSRNFDKESINEIYEIFTRKIIKISAKDEGELTSGSARFIICRTDGDAKLPSINIFLKLCLCLETRKSRQQQCLMKAFSSVA